MVGENNTTKLASIWENKITRNEEKGVRKSQTVDIPNEVVVVKPMPSNSSTDNSPVTVLKSSGAIPPRTDRIPSGALAPGLAAVSSSNSTRGIVETFEKRASENIYEKPLAPVTPNLGTGLRPLKSDLSRRPSNPLSRRASSATGSVDLGQATDINQKIESLTLRVSQLERQLAHMESMLTRNVSNNSNS